MTLDPTTLTQASCTSLNSGKHILLEEESNLKSIMSELEEQYLLQFSYRKKKKGEKFMTRDLEKGRRSSGGKKGFLVSKQLIAHCCTDKVMCFGWGLRISSRQLGLTETVYQPLADMHCAYTKNKKRTDVSNRKKINEKFK